MVRTLLLTLALSGCASRPATPATSPTATVTASPVTSPLDRRTYRAFTLDNGLEALVVSDPDTDKAAAALSVHVGHLADPPHRQGLAHFLEHMLFMGTQDYPDVEAYRRYIDANGGYSNAGTGTETTTYYFEVTPDALDGALDRFAPFFVAPLLDPAYVERERNAVQAEYSLKIKEDVRRVREVKKKTRNPEHPYSKFSVGNLDFLGDGQDTDLHADLRALYDEHYVGDNMALTVVGRAPLDELERGVRDRFAEVPTRSQPPEGPRPAPYLDDQLGVEIRIVPEREVRELQLIFPVPATLEHLEERPLDFLNVLLGDESEGSLYAALKDRGWVEALYASEDGTDDFSLLETHIRLTEDGWASRDQVVTLYFQYVAMLREADLAPLYAQQARLGQLDFRFAELSSPTSLATQTAHAMAYFPTERLLDHRYRWARWDAALVRRYLDALTPDNLRLVAIAPDVVTDRVEALYDTPYAIEPLSPERRAAFEAGGVDATLHPPALNPWIPDDLSLRPGPSMEQPAPLAVDVDGLALWHMLDTSFGVPRAYVQLVLEPAAIDDVDARVHHMLYARLLDDALERFRYPLLKAGLSLRVGADGGRLTVMLSGYDDKLDEVLAETVARVQRFTIDPDRFALEQDRLRRDLRNQRKARPISQNQRALYELLLPDVDPLDAQLDALERVTPDSLERFRAAWSTDVAGRLLVHGNVDAQGARALAATVAPLVSGGSPGARPVRHIAPGSLTVDVPIAHADSTIQVVFMDEGAATADERARLGMLAQLVQTDFFGQLRTEQQLGYIVSASPLTLRDQRALRFAIQSSVADPATLQERIDAFLAGRPDAIRALEPADYQTQRAGLAADVLQAETRLGERFSRLVDELDRGLLDFDSREQFVAALDQLEQGAMADYAARLLLDQPRRLVVRSTGEAFEAIASGDCTAPDCAAIQSWPVLDRER